MATIEGGFASFSCFILDNQLHTHTTPTHVTSIIFFSLPTKKKRKRKNQEPNQTSRVKQLPCSRRFSSFSFSSFFFFLRRLFHRLPGDRHTDMYCGDGHSSGTSYILRQTFTRQTSKRQPSSSSPTEARFPWPTFHQLR